MREHLSDLRTWTVPVLATGFAVALSALCHAYLRPYPFAFFIGAVLISAWYGRLVGSLLATGMGAIMLVVMHARHLGDLGTEDAQDFALRLGMFLFVGIVTGYLSRRCFQAIEAFDGLHQTLACLGQGVILTDPHGAVIYCNPEAEHLTGLDGRDLRDHTVTDVVQVVRDTDHSPLSLELPKLFDTRVPVHFPDDAMLKTRRGDQLAVTGACSPILDGDGLPVGGIVTLQDDSRRRAYLAEVLQRDRWAQNILQDLPMPYLLLDEHAACERVGREATELCGVSAEHWLQEGWHGLIHVEDRERVLEGFRAALGARKPYQTDLRMESDQGESVWVRFRAQRLGSEVGAPVQAMASLAPLTEEKRLEHQLDETRSLLHAIAQASPDAVFLKDAEGRCLLTNAAGAQWQLGPIGEELAQAERDARAHGHPTEVTFSGQQSRAKIVPYHDGDNRVAGLVTFLWDTSAMHAIHTERQTWQRQAEQAGEELNALKARYAQEKQKADADWQRKLQEAIAAREQVEAGLRKVQADAEQRAKALQDANGQLSRRVDELEKQLKAKDQHCAKLEASVRDARDEVQLLEEELTKLQAASQDKLAEAATIAAMRSELETLEERLRDQAADHDESLNQHRLDATERERLNQEEMQRWWAEQEGEHNATVARLEESIRKAEDNVRIAQEHNHLLHAILRSLPDGMLALDGNDRYVAWNERLAQWTGKRSADVIGRSAGELFDELGDLGEDRPVRQLFQGEHLVRKQGRMVLAENGMTHRLDVVYVPVRDASGAFLGAVASVREAPAEEKIIDATPFPEDFGEHLVEPPGPVQRHIEEVGPEAPPPAKQRTTAVVNNAGDWLEFN